MAKIKDSGKRTEFETGAIREIDEVEKGRCDLIYNKGWTDVVKDNFYIVIEEFVRTGERRYVVAAIQAAVCKAFDKFEDAYLEVAKHYAEGAKKYADRNMEKGLPWHSCVDSALRHYTKWRRGDDDEPHARAVIWNLLTLLYMIDNKPELNDLPCKEEK